MSPVAHWVAETARAAENAASKNFSRKVEDYLARLKRGSADTLEQARLHLEAADLQEEILRETSRLAHATFPLVISSDRRALFQRVTDTKPQRRWYGSPRFRYHPTDSQIASYCRNNPHRFYEIYMKPGSRHFVDCVDRVVLPEAAYHSVSRALQASRSLVEAADRQRAALGDLFHLVNNTYAQYLTGQAVRPESLTVGGIHRGNPITGCFALSVSATDLIRSGSGLLRGGTSLATRALGTNPVSPSGLIASLTRNAAGLGLPSFAPSVSLSTFYNIGSPLKIPLRRLPQSWQDLITGRCDGATVAAGESTRRRNDTSGH